MSTTEIDEFVDAFLDRVTAGGDVKKASAAIQLFLADVKGMKKQASPTPSLFAPDAIPKPATSPKPAGFSTSPLPAPAAPPPSPGLQPIRQLAPSNLYSGTEMDLPTAAGTQNTLRSVPPAATMPAAHPAAPSGLPSLVPAPGPAAFQASFGMPYDPSLLSRVQEPDLLAPPAGEKPYAPSVMKAQILQGAKQQADSARYADASAAARSERELVEQGRARFAAQDAKQRAAEAAAASEVRGRWQGMANRYTGDVRAKVQQQNVASDVAGKAKTFLRGLPDAAVRGLTAAGRPDQAAFEARQANAAKIRELEAAMSERATNYDKQEAAQTTAFDSRVGSEAAAVRSRLAALNKRINTGPVPAFKNMPQLTPVNNVGEQDLAERSKLQADLAALEKLKIRKEAPAGVPGLAEQRAQLLASQARNRARVEAQTTVPSKVKTSGFGSTVGEAGTKAYDWTSDKLNSGIQATTDFAKSSPAAYGAGLGALVGAGWTALSPRRKNGSKPWLRNLMIGGAVGGLGMKGLQYLSTMATKPATPVSNPPPVK